MNMILNVIIRRLVEKYWADVQREVKGLSELLLLRHTGHNWTQLVELPPTKNSTKI